ncbi:MAG: bifunctional oligoribonuclease/PAP phosphatase NrnA [Patescibacteria group bacterium]|nr:bifunctional oligoribonuclease/PAP phosphatase NrnA [Patescibacteria group bacterium]
MQLGSLPLQVEEQLHRTRRVLLIGHTQPDADCLGSLSAFAGYLQHFGVAAELYCPTPAPPRLRFLDGVDRLRQTYSGAYDAVVALDCGDLSHAKLPWPLHDTLGSPLVVNIDHHHTNARFGHINLVYPEAASTTEILYHYFRTLDYALPPTLATSLLAGILGDTGGFQYSNTTPGVIVAAAGLIAAGASLPYSADLTFSDKTVPALQCWGRVLSRLTVSPQLQVAIAVISRADLADLPNPIADISGLANFLNSLSGVRAILVLIEHEDGTIRGSLRSRDPLLDVSKFATLMGGGGHRMAAGFTIKGRLEETASGWRIIE